MKIDEIDTNKAFVSIDVSGTVNSGSSVSHTSYHKASMNAGGLC